MVEVFGREGIYAVARLVSSYVVVGLKLTLASDKAPSEVWKLNGTIRAVADLLR